MKWFELALAFIAVAFFSLGSIADEKESTRRVMARLAAISIICFLAIAIFS